MIDIDPAKGVDALKGYLAAASGLTETSVEIAKELAAALVAQGVAQAAMLGAKAPDVVGQLQDQVQDLADGLVVSSRDNREMLAGLISAEVERAAGRMGFVREDELAALRRHVERLQQQVDDLAAARPLSSTPPPAPVAPAEAVAPTSTAQSSTVTDATPLTAAETAAVPEATATPDVPKPKKKIYLDPEAQQ